jgi:hypothetical protein
MVLSFSETVHITPDLDASGSVKDISLKVSRHKIDLFVNCLMENLSLEPAAGIVKCMQTLNARAVAAPGFSLPETIEVMHGKVMLDATQYTFDPESGDIIVPDVREDISIRAVAVPVEKEAIDDGDALKRVVDLLDKNKNVISPSMILVSGLLVSMYGLWSIRN